jgi:hypothetical protein
MNLLEDIGVFVGGGGIILLSSADGRKVLKWITK